MSIKKTKKRISCLLAGCMLAGMLPSAAYARETAASEAPAAGIETVGQSDADGGEYGIMPQNDIGGGIVSYRVYNEDIGKMEDADKNEEECTLITENTTGNVDWSGWYVVKGQDVTIDGTVTLTGDTHLILCDGAELKVTGGITDGDQSKRTLTIYGQSKGTGKLTVNNGTQNDENGAGIRTWVGGGFTINGGVVEATGADGVDSSHGIYGSVITIHEGSVTGNGGNGEDESYGIFAGSLNVDGGTIHGTHKSSASAYADIMSYKAGISGGTFTADLVLDLYSSIKEYYISGGIFEKRVVSVNDKCVTELLADGYVFQKADDTVPILRDKVKDLKTIENVTVVPCPHSAKEKEGVTCEYCGKIFAVRNETTKNLYIKLYDALWDDEATDGDIIRLYANVTDSVICGSKYVTLDLNGNTLSHLHVAGKPLIITDSAGGGRISALSIGAGVTVSDLLLSGYAFCSTDGTWYDATHNANVKEATNVSVKPQPITGMTITPTAGSCTYGYAAADAPTFIATVNKAEGVTEPVTYAWYVKEHSDSDFVLQVDAIEADFQFPAGQNAGTYDVKCVADCDGYKLEQTVTVTVDKADAVCTDVPAAKQDLSYIGSPQALITAGTVVGGAMQYQLNGGVWSTEIPTAENIGTYHIRYKVVGDENHNDSAEAELTVTIAKAAPAVSTDLTASVTYGDAVKAADIKGAMCNAYGSNVTGTFEWENVTDYGDATGENETHTLYATFIPADTVNYDCAAHIPVAVTVAKAAYTGTTAADGSAKYGVSNTLDLSGLVMSGGKAVIDTVTDTSDVLDGTPTIDGTTLAFVFNENAVPDQTATVTVNVSDCKNYQNYIITVTLTVNDRNVPTVTAPAVKTLTYNGADQVLIEAAETTGGTLQYSLDNHTWSAELPKAKTAGRYTVYYKVNGNDDYADVPAASVTVTIGRKAVTVKPKSYSITQGNAIPAFALEYVGLVNGDILNITAAPAFTCCEADGNTAVSTFTAAGSYTITWTNSDVFNFDSETNYTVMKETIGTLTISAKSGSSGGGGGYSGGASGGAAPAPSEKPTDKPDQEPANKPTIDRNELLQTANRLTYQIMYRLPLPVFPRVMWSWLLDFKFFI